MLRRVIWALVGLLAVAVLLSIVFIPTPMTEQDWLPAAIERWLR